MIYDGEEGSSAFFAAHPQRVVPNPASLIRRATEIITRIRTSLRRQLGALAARGVHVTIVSERVLWDGEPALWLTMDGEDALALYQTCEAVVRAIRQAVRREPETDLRRHVLDFQWPYVVVVPLVRGRSLHASA